MVPVGWLVYTLVRRAFVDWCPYPFLDVDELGYAAVAVSEVVVSALMLGLASWPGGSTRGCRACVAGR